MSAIGLVNIVIR